MFNDYRHFTHQQSLKQAELVLNRRREALNNAEYWNRNSRKKAFRDALKAYYTLKNEV